MNMKMKICACMNASEYRYRRPCQRFPFGYGCARDLTVWPCLWVIGNDGIAIGIWVRKRETSVVSSAAEPALTLACLKPNLINKNLVKPYTFKAHTPPTLLVRKNNLKSLEKLRRRRS